MATKLFMAKAACGALSACGALLDRRPGALSVDVCVCDGCIWFEQGYLRVEECEGSGGDARVEMYGMMLMAEVRKDSREGSELRGHGLMIDVRCV